jgi:glycerol transport system ATP-binding protein
MPAAGLELKGVCKRVQDQTHLADIDLRCAPGSFTVLLGRVRSGKTSLLRIMAGLDRPTSGTVGWNGVDVTRKHVRERDVAMVYQQFINYPSLSVYENIASPLRVQRRHTKAEIDRRVREIAALLHIEPLLPRRPAELSGGQQQRTAMARVLAKSAKLVLLDEPLANLDYKLREELRGQLRSLFAGSDTIVVYATAEPSEALELGGQTVVLHEGRLLQTGAALEVYGKPANEHVARIYSDPELNVFEVEVSQGSARPRLHPELIWPLRGPLAGLSTGIYRFGVRAHEVRTAARSPHDLQIAAQVELEEISGSETLLRAQSGELTWTALLQGVQQHERGSPVPLFISPESVYAFDAGGTAVITSAADTHGAH